MAYQIQGMSCRLTSSDAQSKVQPHYTYFHTFVDDKPFEEGRYMAVSRSILIVLAFVFGVPAALFAQATASIAGVVQDASGAILPGVTVEASSPALIEKVRTVVTDSAGQYKIEQLRGGVYTVTFTLSGFSTLRREGIELSGSFTATVNAELKVGSLAETLTVTGESPLVDLQS